MYSYVQMHTVPYVVTRVYVFMSTTVTILPRQNILHTHSKMYVLEDETS